MPLKCFQALREHIGEPASSRRLGLFCGAPAHRACCRTSRTLRELLQLKRKTPGDVLSVTVFNDKEGSKVVKVELGALGKTQAEVPLCAVARACVPSMGSVPLERAHVVVSAWL